MINPFMFNTVITVLDNLLIVIFVWIMITKVELFVITWIIDLDKPVDHICYLRYYFDELYLFFTPFCDWKLYFFLLLVFPCH